MTATHSYCQLGIALQKIAMHGMPSLTRLTLQAPQETNVKLFSRNMRGNGTNSIARQPLQQL